LILGNLTAFLCFFMTCGPVLERAEPAYFLDWAAFAAWLASGMATLVFWAMAALPTYVWGRLVKQSRGSIFAGLLLGLAACGASFLAMDQWRLLSKATLQVVKGMLSLIFADVVSDAKLNMIGTSTFNVEISPACSGYEGMGLMACLIVAALWALRHDFRFPRAFALLPLAIGLAWVANAFRITALVALGNWGYPDLAVGGFHSLAGWVLFLLIGLGLIACAVRMPLFSKRAAEPRMDGPAFDAAYLVPAMTLIATSMVTATFSPGLDRYYFLRVVFVAIAFAVYRKAYTELRLTLSWAAVAIGIAVFAFWMVLEPRGTPATSESPLQSSVSSLSQASALTWVIFRVIGSVIMVPLAEELAFRGYLTRRLISSDFRAVTPGKLTWISFLVSSALFGLLHGRWFAGTLAGMAYAWAYHRRGELTDAVVAHAVTNGLIAVAVLATGAWSLWA
jgi:exosortase E/protease (VPEID-CTERM system)